MKAASSASARLTGANLWLTARRSSPVVVVAGIDSSEIVEAALADAALLEAAIPRFEPNCTLPCDALLWRLETASGETLNKPGLLRSHWHRAPYAITLRLVQYQPGTVAPEILDEGTLCTRGSRGAFKVATDRLAMRFLRDVALARARGPSDRGPAGDAHGLPGWLDAVRSRWRDRLMAEWWSLGTTAVPLERVLSGHGLDDITWYCPEVGSRYLAAAFPVPGQDRIVCQEMPLNGGTGRIVSVAESNGNLLPPTVLLDDGRHHSYPCIMSDGDVAYCVPHSAGRGQTRIHRLDQDGELYPVCDPAPHSRVADPTLFQRDGRYWLACTDLDVGPHDNLCLLHAPTITGPWSPHARWPVKIDVRGARPAGPVFDVAGRLFRPGQDCAASPGAGIAIHEILTLAETDFRETLVTVLRPDKTGRFPHGLRTLASDGNRFWIDGKRRVLEPGRLRRGLGRATQVVRKAGAA
jgi:hypothetical protein